MYVFTKQKDPNNPHDYTNVTISINESDVMVDELVQAFEDFLKASGFSSDIKLEVGSYSDENGAPLDA